MKYLEAYRRAHENVHLRWLEREETMCGRVDAEALRHAWTLDAAIAGTANPGCSACWERWGRLR